MKATNTLSFQNSIEDQEQHSSLIPYQPRNVGERIIKLHRYASLNELKQSFVSNLTTWHSSKIRVQKDCMSQYELLK